MEKWKIGVIGLLLLGLVGYGISSQSQSADPVADAVADVTADTAVKTGQPDVKENKAAVFLGQSLGSGDLPEWSKVGPWENTQQAVTVESLKGGPALVEFFRINCSHCQEAAPFLESLYQRYQPRGLKMAAVQSPGNYKDTTNEETMWPRVQSWVKAAGVTYPVAMDKDSDYFQGTIDGNYYPTTLITDANGKVVYSQTGHDLGKSIALAVELEKQFPGAGTPKERAQNLAEFLKPTVFGTNEVDTNLYKSLTDDLEQRLMGKV